MSDDGSSTIVVRIQSCGGNNLQDPIEKLNLMLGYRGQFLPGKGHIGKKKRGSRKQRKEATSMYRVHVVGGREEHVSGMRESEALSHLSTTPLYQKNIYI